MFGEYFVVTEHWFQANLLLHARVFEKEVFLVVRLLAVTTVGRVEDDGVRGDGRDAPALRRNGKQGQGC